MARMGLVVDDDAPSRKIYGSMLAHLGFQIQEATDGEEALAILKDNKFDVIFLDMLLPKVNGLKVLEYIYAAPHLKSARVIIITAHTSYKYEVSLRPGDTYFLKPVPASEVRDFLSRSMQEDPS